MDIHNPKGPIRGWRELAREIGIIVIGVLIALGAGQVAETLRERHDAAEARAAIRAEIAQNLGRMTVRARSDDCVKTRLTEVGGLIDKWAGGRPPSTPVWIGRPQRFTMYTAGFAAATSGGRASLLPREEQAAYGRIYALLEVFSGAIERERSAWAQIRVLEDAPRFNAALEADLRMARQEAANDRAGIAQATREALRNSQAIGIRPDLSSWPDARAQGQGMVGVCIPMNTPRDQAIEMFYGGGPRTSEP